MENLPPYIYLAFAVTCIATVYFFYKAARRSKTVLFIITVWIALQSIVSLTGFYEVTSTLPPRFILLIAPPLLLTVILFITKKGRAFLDGLDLKFLTILHVIRIPVEILLYALFVRKVVPEIMTLEGRNLDIISGVTTPAIYYLRFMSRRMGNTGLLIWNLVCLALLINIVVIAIFSAPFPFQQFGFEQPAVALLYFPFVLLPCCIVPLVLISHLVSIRLILVKKAPIFEQKAMVVKAA